MIPRSAQQITFPPERLSSRNAVETAIDLSRSDRHSTWEGIAIRMRNIIKPWEAVVRSDENEKRDE